MLILWIFFIILNLFYIFYFDENIFYFFLFSIIFMPNFFNVNFSLNIISLSQFKLFLVRNLNWLLYLIKNIENFNKDILKPLFLFLASFFTQRKSLDFMDLFKFLNISFFYQIQQKVLVESYLLIEFMELLFFKTKVNLLIKDKKKTVALAKNSIQTLSDVSVLPFGLSVVEKFFNLNFCDKNFSKIEMQKIVSLLKK